MILRDLRILVANVGDHAGTKLVCHAGISAWIAFFYFGPQCWPLFDARAAPELPIDGWIPFQPGWVWIYQSVFLVHTLALWLPADRAAVKRYASQVAIVFAAGAAVFWLFPTLSPRPSLVESMAYQWLIVAVDGQRNAFPSLHAAMGSLAVLNVRRHFRAARLAQGWQLALAGWWVALLYSTLATRQHRLLDLAAGICLGLLSFALPAVISQARRRHAHLPTHLPRTPACQRRDRADARGRRSACR